MANTTGTSSFSRYAEIWLDEAGRERQVFTTGQIAKLAHVAPRTVTKWFDKGLLSGWKIPGSEDRRVSRESYIAFCSENKIPLIGLVQHIPVSVLSIGINPHIPVPDGGVYEYHDNFFTCYDQFNPYAVSHRIAVVIDASLGPAMAMQFVRSLRAKTPGKLLNAYLVGDLTGGEIKSAKSIGYTECYQSYELEKLREEITRFAKDEESSAAIAKRYLLERRKIKK